jgi:hypothetical protein
MKYFRRHPDLILITVQPQHARLTRTIVRSLGRTKKILVVTDPKMLLRNFIYNHQTQTLCAIYHGEWFMPILMAVSRLTKKRIVVVMTTKPRSFLARTLRDIVSALASATLPANKQLKKTLDDTLFPSLTLNLGIMGA